MTTDVLFISERFCGPPSTGNGGYVSGRLAAYIDSPAPVVRLEKPPPLNRALRIERSNDVARLLDGESIVAVARPGSVSLEPPVPPSFEEATRASRAYRGFTSHSFPSCFVCGPNRKPSEGLRIFAGATDDGSGMVAAPWRPDATLSNAYGMVAPEYLWAALDCPGAFSFPEPPDCDLLLGEICVALTGEVAENEACVVVAWEVARDGRKHHTGTALFGRSGSLRGIGLAIWFEVPRG